MPFDRGVALSPVDGTLVDGISGGLWARPSGCGIASDRVGELGVGKPSSAVDRGPKQKRPATESRNKRRTKRCGLGRLPQASKCAKFRHPTSSPTVDNTFFPATRKLRGETSGGVVVNKVSDTSALKTLQWRRTIFPHGSLLSVSNLRTFPVSPIRSAVGAELAILEKKKTAVTPNDTDEATMQKTEGC